MSNNRANKVAGTALAGFVGVAGLQGCTTTMNVKNKLEEADKTLRLVVDQRPSKIKDAFRCVAEATRKTTINGRPLRFEVLEGGDETGFSSQYTGGGLTQSPHSRVFNTLSRNGFNVGDLTNDLITAKKRLQYTDGTSVRNIDAGQQRKVVLKTDIVSFDLNNASSDWSINAAFFEISKDSQLTATEICTRAFDPQSGAVLRSSCQKVAAGTSGVVVDRSGYDWQRLLGAGMVSPNTYGAAGMATQTSVPAGAAIELGVNSTLLDVTSAFASPNMTAQCKQLTIDALTGDEKTNPRNVVLKGKKSISGMPNLGL